MVFNHANLRLVDNIKTIDFNESFISWQKPDENELTDSSESDDDE
jgi:hypothetical protein